MYKKNTRNGNCKKKVVGFCAFSGKYKKNKRIKKKKTNKELELKEKKKIKKREKK